MVRTNRIVESLLGPRYAHHETVASSVTAPAYAPTVNDACSELANAFQEVFVYL